MAYNKDQWIESFEGQLAILRPHLTARVLGSMSMAAWHKLGRNDQDPIEAAKAWSSALGVPAAPDRDRKRDRKAS